MQTFFFNFFFYLLVLTLSRSLLCNLDDKIFLCSANKACRAQEQGTKSEIRRGFIHATRYYIHIHTYLYSCLAINISACHQRTNERSRDKRNKKPVKVEQEICIERVDRRDKAVAIEAVDQHPLSY